MVSVQCVCARMCVFVSAMGVKYECLVSLKWVLGAVIAVSKPLLSHVLLKM